MKEALREREERKRRHEPSQAGAHFPWQPAWETAAHVSMGELLGSGAYRTYKHMGVIRRAQDFISFYTDEDDTLDLTKNICGGLVYSLLTYDTNVLISAPAAAPAPAVAVTELPGTPRGVARIRLVAGTGHEAQEEESIDFTPVVDDPVRDEEFD